MRAGADRFEFAGTSDLFESSRVAAARWVSAAIFILAAHVLLTTMALLNWSEVEVADAAAGATIVDMLPAPAAPVDSPDVAHGPQVEEAMLAPPPTLETKPAVVEEQPKLEPAPLAPEPEVALPIATPVEEQKPKEEEAKQEVKEKVETQESAAPLTMAPPKVEPTPEPPVAAKAAAGAHAEQVKRIELSWQKTLVSHLNRFKRYPTAARARGAQGYVLVEFTIDRSGNVVASRVLQHSGSAFLDDEAMAVLQRASPLPRPPAELTGELFPLTLPIQFRMK